MKSVSGLVLYVKDLGKTADFYKTLGFRFGESEADHTTAYLNWFSIIFVAGDQAALPKEAKADNKGAGIFINIKVEDVDEFYKATTAKGLKPVSPPRDHPWGNREFMLRDPDGYKLVFFQKS